MHCPHLAALHGGQPLASQQAIPRPLPALLTLTAYACTHRKAYVHSDKLMDFLKDTVASAPDLREGEEIAAPKPKRQR